MRLSKHPLAKGGTDHEGKMAKGKKMGRPKIEINWEVFDTYCALQCTLREIAHVLGCSEDTIERRVREQKGMSFAEYFNRKRVVGLMSLRRYGFEMAKKHPAVWIFCAKNWLGMTDKQEIEHSGIHKDHTTLTDEQLEALIEG